jgi:UDP-N-acetylglucosamine 2-epimerase (non-hydrolysing)
LEHAAAVLTDSGGVQEESTYLQVPCLTFRPHTERPVTVEMGTNALIPELDPILVTGHLKKIFSGHASKSMIPPMWDGHAGERIAAILSQTY